MDDNHYVQDLDLEGGFHPEPGLGGPNTESEGFKKKMISVISVHTVSAVFQYFTISFNVPLVVSRFGIARSASWELMKGNI